MHAVLLGDSIFDNAGYVPGEPSVIEQIRRYLESSWQATLLAVDGDVTEDVPRQTQGLPNDATHLIMSCGGNDALRRSSILKEKASSVAEGFEVAALLRDEFRANYQSTLTHLLSFQKPLAVCTVYDAIPGLGEAEKSALAMYNEIILKEAFIARLPVIDLRLICDDTRDYSALSPIEPSSAGGDKITQVIAELLQTHDFSARRSVIYS